MAAARAARAGLAARAVLAAALLTSGCQLTTVEVAAPEDVIVVEAYLRSDVASQEVFLYRTITGEGESLRVDGAEVRIVDEEGRALPFAPVKGNAACAGTGAFEEGLGGSCYTSGLAGDFVRPGESYKLEVTLSDGRHLTGVTTMPGDFQVLQPSVRDCVLDTTTYALIWSESSEAWSYQVVADFSGLAQGLRERGVENPPDELQLTGLAVSGTDTTITFPAEFGVFDRFLLDRDLLLALQDGLPEGARADIVFAAADRNYVNWVRGGNFNPSGQVRVPSVGGDGTGVFGSLVVHRRSLLTEDQGNGLPTCQ